MKLFAIRTSPSHDHQAEDEGDEPAGDHHDDGHGGHGHSHGLVDRSIVRSHEGIKAVSISLAVLGVAAVAQTLIFILSGSVALLADLIHNYGDALRQFRLASPFSSAARAGRSWRDLRWSARSSSRRA